MHSSPATDPPHSYLSPRIPVYLSTIPSYQDPGLTRQIGEQLQKIIPDIPSQTRVLVKPNLLTGKKSLATTHPIVVKSVVAYLLDCGVHVTIGDSPAFGSAEKVAQKTGLAGAITGMPVTLVSLGNPEKTHLPCGVSIGLSRQALEVDLILNLPKLKAHSQLLVTGAVKNLFGCVVGGRKALAHYRHGDIGTLFQRMLVEIPQMLPKTISVMDAITVMSGTGPIDGIACTLSLLGVSENPVALDTAIYTALELSPSDVIVWEEARKNKIEGSDPSRIDYPLKRPEEIDVSGFLLLDTLKPVTFHPVRLLKGRLKSLMARFG